MADQDFDRKARQIARYVVAELQNQNGLVTIDEAKQLAQIEGGDSYFCTNCGYEFPSDDLLKSKCPKCGNTKASPNPKYRCSRCNRPVDLGMPSCPSCGTESAIESKSNSRTVVSVRNPMPHFACKDCLAEVNLEQPSCSCGGREAYRTIER